MIDKNETYKVVNEKGLVYVTYNDITKARQFIKNMAKERKIKLYIKGNKDDTKK